MGAQYCDVRWFAGPRTAAAELIAAVSASAAAMTHASAPPGAAFFIHPPRFCESGASRRLRRVGTAGRSPAAPRSFSCPPVEDPWVDDGALPAVDAVPFA